jgi:hypothetical protein
MTYLRFDWGSLDLWTEPERRNTRLYAVVPGIPPIEPDHTIIPGMDREESDVRHNPHLQMTLGAPMEFQSPLLTTASAVATAIGATVGALRIALGV